MDNYLTTESCELCNSKQVIVFAFIAFLDFNLLIRKKSVCKILKKSYWKSIFLPHFVNNCHFFTLSLYRLQGNNCENINNRNKTFLVFVAFIEAIAIPVFFKNCMRVSLTVILTKVLINVSNNCITSKDKFKTSHQKLFLKYYVLKMLKISEF